MNTIETNTAELHPAELLLPWYVSGNLSNKEKAEVDIWLHENPEAQAHLSRVEEEHIVTIESAEEIPMPRAAAVNDLLAAISGDARKQNSGASLSERFFALLTPRWAMAGAAALALLLVAQGTTIGMLVSEPPATFETASGPTETVSGITALVAFQSTQSVADISAYLEDNGLTIIGGPKPGGIYRITAENSDKGRAAFKALSQDKVLVSFFTAQGDQ